MDHQARYRTLTQQYDDEREQFIWLKQYVEDEMDALGVTSKRGRKSFSEHALSGPGVKDEETGREVPDFRGLMASAPRDLRRKWR
jgi:hypothetical protein